MAVAIQRNNIITNITVFNRQQGLITVHFVIFISQIVCKMLSSSIVVFFVSTTSFMSSVDIKRNSKILVFLLFFIRYSFLFNLTSRFFDFFDKCIFFDDFRTNGRRCLTLLFMIIYIYL